MEALHQKYYKNQVIMEQYITNNDLYIITRHEGKWYLYHDNKKICESKDYYKVIDKIPD